MARLIASYFRHIPPAPLNVGIPKNKRDLGVRPCSMRGDHASPPEAAESPAPATAMICFDDDNSSLNAAMSADGREDIFWSHKGDVVAMRDMCLRLSKAIARVLRCDPRIIAMMAPCAYSTKFYCQQRTSSPPGRWWRKFFTIATEMLGSKEDGNSA